MKPTTLLIITLVIAVSCFGSKEESLRSEIQQNRQELQRLEKREENQIEKLDALSRQITLVNDLVEELREKDSLLTVRLNRLNDSLAQKRDELDSARALQAEVLRAMYIRGKGGEFAFLLGSEGLGDFISRIGYFVFLAEERRHISELTDNAARQVEILIDSTESVHSEVIRTRQTRESELDSLRAAREQKQAIIAEIRQDKSTYRRAIEEMEQSLVELTQQIPQARMEGDFEKYRGSLPWPTSSNRILHPFGIVKEQRFGTEFKNAGIDIATKPEERVIAVAPGRVAHISWLRGYGRIVILEHAGGYFSVYGNLGKVQVIKDERVSNGQVIGYTAPDGWLEGAKLHFEIRKGKMEVNPVDWLVTA